MYHKINNMSMKCWNPPINNNYNKVVFKLDLELVKSSNPTEYTQIGEEITYTYIVTNNGTVELNNIIIQDNKISNLPIIEGPIFPGENKSIQGKYSITQDDINDGSLTNIAIAIDSIYGFLTETSLTINFTLTDDFNIIKSSNTGTYDLPGQLINYTYRITNNGNTTLNNIVVTDDILGDVGIIPSLNPNAFFDLSKLYMVTQDDLDQNRIITNIGTALSNNISRNSNPVSVIAFQNPVFVVIKSATVCSGTGEGAICRTGSYDSEGQVITYTYRIGNNGNITLNNINVTDDQLGFIGTISNLSPGNEDELTKTYAITQEDLDQNRIITNFATGTYNDISVDSNSVTINPIQNPDFVLTKSANTGSYDMAGQIITYTYTVENTGNITLNNINVTDDQLGVIGSIFLLSPNTQSDLTANYVITQSDLDENRIITNFGTAIYDNISKNSNSVVVEPIQNANLTIVISSDTGSYDIAGQIINYTYTITNIANVPLNNIEVTDDIFGPIGSIPSLNVGAFSDLMKTYTILQSDLNENRTITNIGTAIYNNMSINSDPVSVTAVQNPHLTINKSGSNLVIDNQITYTYTVTNDGNITLNNITFNDDKGVIVPNIPILNVGETISVTGAYEFQEGELTITNNVVAISDSGVSGSTGITLTVDSFGFEDGEGSFVIPNGYNRIEYVIMGGGGGGGGGAEAEYGGEASGGGGGGRGILGTGTINILPNDVINYKAGAGGLGGNLDGEDGEESYIKINNYMEILVNGGSGGKYGYPHGDGGNDGGGGGQKIPRTIWDPPIMNGQGGKAGQGDPGQNGGTFGGQGNGGYDGGNGGNGVSTTLFPEIFTGMPGEGGEGGISNQPNIGFSNICAGGGAGGLGAINENIKGNDENNNPVAKGGRGYGAGGAGGSARHPGANGASGIVVFRLIPPSIPAILETSDTQIFTTGTGSYNNIDKTKLEFVIMGGGGNGGNQGNNIGGGGGGRGILGTGTINILPDEIINYSVGSANNSSTINISSGINITVNGGGNGGNGPAGNDGGAAGHGFLTPSSPGQGSAGDINGGNGGDGVIVDGYPSIFNGLVGSGGIGTSMGSGGGGGAGGLGTMNPVKGNDGIGSNYGTGGEGYGAGGGGGGPLNGTGGTGASGIVVITPK